MPPLEPLLWSEPLWRIANEPELTLKSYPSPRYRFDAPRGQFAALYTCATDIGTFAETYADRARRLGFEDRRRYLLEIHPTSPISLIDFHNIDVLMALCLDERISVGDDYAACQEWALAIYQHSPKVGGIRYRARKAGATVSNVVLFGDRCMGALDVVSARRLDSIEEIVLRAADAYRLTVLFSFSS